jgi:hypothetical protein
MTATFLRIQTVVKECPHSGFFMSIIIMAAYAVEMVLLIRILNGVMSALEVSSSPE